jgi:hypothetical protein
MKIFDLAFQQCQRTFGDQAVYSPTGGSPFNIVALFTPNSIEVDLETSAPVVSSNPVVEVRAMDFPNPPRLNDSIKIKNVDYKVIEILPDYAGGISLIIKRNAIKGSVHAQ